MDSNESDNKNSFAHILYRRLTRSIQSVLHIQSKSNSSLACSSSETSNRLTKSDKETPNKKKKQRKRKKNKNNKSKEESISESNYPKSSEITTSITELSTSKDVNSFRLSEDFSQTNDITNTAEIIDEVIQAEKEVETEKLDQDIEIKNDEEDKVENYVKQLEIKDVEENFGIQECTANFNYFEQFYEDAIYEACLVGSSIVMDIDASLVFPNKKCLFKSICGGETIHLFEYLRENEHLLRKCKYFVLACGSNDCGSPNDMTYVINVYTQFLQYLKEVSPNAYLICNKLIPRTYSGSQDVDEFEERRHIFNNYLDFGLPLVMPCRIVEHPAFENKDNLSSLLYDGVHISLEGLPIYISEMRQVIDNLE